MNKAQECAAKYQTFWSDYLAAETTKIGLDMIDLASKGRNILTWNVGSKLCAARLAEAVRADGFSVSVSPENCSSPTCLTITFHTGE